MVIFNEKGQFYSSDHLKSNYKAGFGTKRFKIDKLAVEYQLVRLNQIHSNKVITIKDYQPIKNKRLVGDGLVTNLKKVALLISTADCLPIIYLDQKNGVIAISHNGWRGSRQRIAQKVIKSMIDLGAEMKEIAILLGPSIGACCYSINEEREAIFNQNFASISDRIILHNQGRVYLNLPLLNYFQLMEIGIRKSQVDFSLFCTYCDKETFFSYRRRGKKKGREMINFVVKD